MDVFEASLCYSHCRSEQVPRGAQTQVSALSVMSWLIFRNWFCALACVEEVVRCLGGVLTSWKHRLVLFVFNALAAGHQARCISWKRKC